MLPSLGQFISCLHSQQRVGFYAEGLFEADRHIGREVGIAIEQGAERLPRDTKMFRKRRHTDLRGCNDLSLQPIADMGGERRVHPKSHDNPPGQYR